MDDRIFPIVGNTLHGKRIAVAGARGAWALDLLRSCGARAWRTGAGVPDALIADAAVVTPGAAARWARGAGRPAVALCWPRNGWAMGHAWLCRPGDAPAALPEPGTPRATLDELELGALAADLVRAWFTAGTPYAPPGWPARLAAGRTLVSLGAADWPWRVAWDTPADFALRASPSHPFTCSPPHPLTPSPLHPLIFGLGSVGSWTAHALRPYAARFTLVDPDTVAAVNLARQWYHAGQVGQDKPGALAANLALPCACFPAALDTAALDALLRASRPDVAVVATGGDDDFGIARVLRRHGVPHVVGRCYPRARFFEAIVVDGARGVRILSASCPHPRRGPKGAEGGPCLGCLRGHLYTGPAPRPTPEELAAYGPVTREAPTQPATRLEVGRLALVLARLALALGAPVRPPWLESLVASGQTCLLGANVIEDGAYGLREPLQVAGYGLDDIVGTQAHEYCPDCGRRNTVAHRV
jgi:hypothetical protein